MLFCFHQGRRSRRQRESLERSIWKAGRSATQVTTAHTKSATMFTDKQWCFCFYFLCAPLDMLLIILIENWLLKFEFNMCISKTVMPEETVLHTTLQTVVLMDWYFGHSFWIMYKLCSTKLSTKIQVAPILKFWPIPLNWFHIADNQ